MPVCLNFKHSDQDRLSGSTLSWDEPSVEFQEQSSKCITIGLINNMPDGALEATERQFLSLLNLASDGILIRLSLLSLPGVPRNEVGARHIEQFYSSVESLWDTHLDGLIVTGREPLTPNLSDEPYWESFTRVLEWARDNTHSAVWSCLAAHAAVLHMDGIGRVRSSNKHCGVFECARVSHHPLMTGASSRFALPHSRWNGVPETALTSCGYSVLTRAADAGVDTFVKRLNSLFVFFQGHPEYESNTLLLEYRRDIWRFLKGDTDRYPSTPRYYFDRNTVNVLAELSQEAISRPREEFMTDVSSALAKIMIENTWHSTAACIYRNWLEYICAQKELRLSGSRFTVEAQEAGRLTPLLAAMGDASVSYP